MKLHCPKCRTVLGEELAGHYIFSHRGRQAIMTGLQSVTCDRCDRTWPADELQTDKRKGQQRNG